MGGPRTTNESASRSRHVDDEEEGFFFLQFVSIGVLYYVKGVFVRLISGRKGKLHQVTCFLII